MAYIGKAPTPAQLTTDGITDDTITTAKLADASVTAAKVNGLTSSIVELNSVDGITADSADLNRLGVTTLGTAEASKVVTTDASNNVTVSGDITAGTLLGDGSQISNLPPTGGAHTATADGAITDGDTCVVNSNGTVSKVSKTTTAVSPPTVGTVQTLIDGQGRDLGERTATNGSDTVVQITADANGYAELRVGTIASGGTSVSYGTPVTIWSGSISSASVVHLSEMAGGQTYAFVVNQYDASGTSVVRAFSVSGTTATFGAQRAYGFNAFDSRLAYDRGAGDRVYLAYYDFNAGDLKAWTLQVTGVDIDNPSSTTQYVVDSSYGDGLNNNHQVSFDLSYDENADRLLIGIGSRAFTQPSTVNKTYLVSRSGSALTIHSTSNFTSYVLDADLPKIQYDPISQKHLIYYSKDVSPFTAYYRVATVNASNNTVSFGTETSISTFNRVIDFSTSVNRPTGEILINYRNIDDNSDAYFITATISGTSATFGTAVEWLTTNFDGFSVASLDDGRAVVMAMDSSEVQKTAVIRFSNTVANLTSENFIGISNGAYADGATATIQTAGVVDDAQSGLTAGQSYFVQGNGTLGLTADSPSVFAGTAVSATEIIVQG